VGLSGKRQQLTFGAFSTHQKKATINIWSFGVSGKWVSPEKATINVWCFQQVLLEFALHCSFYLNKKLKYLVDVRGQGQTLGG